MFAGILFAILTGLSWIAVGAVVGLAEKRGCGTARQQLVGHTITGTITTAVLALGVALRPGAPAFSLRAAPAPVLWTALWGFLNYYMSLCMGRAMRTGPNGTVWTIVQCGFVFPFVLGVAIGNTALTAPRAAGLLCVLVGVFFCGRARTATAHRAAARRENGRGGSGGAEGAATGSGGGWLAPALAGFVLCGVNQCAQCMASLAPPEERPTALVRILCGVAGAFAALLPHRFWLWRERRREGIPPDPDLGAKYRFLLKICAVSSAIFFLSSFCFLYNALDRLEEAGRIAVANPTMLAACLVGFTIYGAAFLRERPSRAQLLGTVFALAGIGLVAA